jgi:hypothetical protein
MSLTKQQILAIAPRLKEVDVPEWCGSVFIRPLTIHEQAKLADLGTKYEKGSVVDRMKNCTLRWSSGRCATSMETPFLRQPTSSR